MHKRKKIFPVFIIFLAISIFIFVLSQFGWLSSATSVFQSMIVPIQRASLSIFKPDNAGELNKLKNENRDLRTQLAKIKSIEQDNQALRDQFAISNPTPRKLIPAYIVRIPAFLPGISYVDNVIIDKGSQNNIKSGQKVVYKDNLIGIVVKTSPQLSQVNLLNNKDISFTARTNNTSAIGIINGVADQNFILKNVLLSDVLHTGDTVVTKDPPLLVVGKIISVNKKASSLFQTAEVQSLVDVMNLKMVFVILEN